MQKMEIFSCLTGESDPGVQRATGRERRRSAEPGSFEEFWKKVHGLEGIKGNQEGSDAFSAHFHMTSHLRRARMALRKADADRNGGGLMRLFTDEEIRAFFRCVSSLTADSRVRRLRTIPHHRWTNRYEHVLLVSYISFALARRWHWDSRAAARAGLLHDLFFQEADSSLSLCLHHPEMAAENAEQVTHLTERERNIILSHMWPAGRYLPRSREAWLVNLVDDLVALLDLSHLSGRWSRRLGTAAGR